MGNVEKVKVGSIVRIKTIKEFNREGVYPEVDWVSNAVQYCGKTAKISKILYEGNSETLFKLEGFNYDWSPSELVFLNKLDVE